MKAQYKWFIFEKARLNWMGEMRPKWHLRQTEQMWNNEIYKTFFICFLQFCISWNVYSHTFIDTAAVTQHHPFTSLLRLKNLLKKYLLQYHCINIYKIYTSRYIRSFRKVVLYYDIFLKFLSYPGKTWYVHFITVRIILSIQIMTYLYWHTQVYENVNTSQPLCDG